MWEIMTNLGQRMKKKKNKKPHRKNVKDLMSFGSQHFPPTFLNLLLQWKIFVLIWICDEI